MIKRLDLLYVCCLVYSADTLAASITYNFSGGRFADNLSSYSKALWIAYKHDVPILYKKFLYSDQLVLHTKHPRFTTGKLRSFNRVIPLSKEAPATLINTQSNNLYICVWGAHVCFDWNDPAFVDLARQMICSRSPLEKIKTPKDRVSIAIHIRTGGSYDIPKEKLKFPLRFLPDSYFIEQIHTIADIFSGHPLHVHVFTDDDHPSKIMQRFKQGCQDLDVTFSCREQCNKHDRNVLIDFFSMMDFDCLIRVDSKYSTFAQRLGNFKIVIIPAHVSFDRHGNKIVDKVSIIQK